MASPKRITDLKQFQNILPYASEMFGVYQPLLGWKSRRMQKRIMTAVQKDQSQAIHRFAKLFSSYAEIDVRDPRNMNVMLETGKLVDGKTRISDSMMLQQLSTQLPSYDKYTPAVWDSYLTEATISKTLKEGVSNHVKKSFTLQRAPLTGTGANLMAMEHTMNAVASTTSSTKVLQAQMHRESAMAGAVQYLAKTKQYSILEKLFYQKKDNRERVSQLTRVLNATDAIQAYLDLEHMNPQDKREIESVALSPISVVHLFRQYFFELDSFLGTPVSHVWLSPGSEVEMVETHTRRALTERTLETTLDTFMKSEKSTTEEEEISDAVKSDNDQNIKFGASVTASYASIEATSSFDYSSSQRQARETTHKRMRQQSEKLSSEIRKNFKTTFKQVTELTDISSIKHSMRNTTNDLVNYELRRKMRQVGVQVQDIGTFLCWQTYVDNPGEELGLSKLIHIAKSAELDGLPHPDEIPLLQPFEDVRRVTIPFISVANDADNEGEVYVNGVEADDSEFLGSLEKIQADFKQEFVCPKSDFVLTNVEFDSMGQPVTLSRSSGISNNGGKASFTLHLDSADFQGKNNMEVGVILHWAPLDAANEEIRQQNETNLRSFKEQERKAYEKAYVETVKERVTMASKITTRKSEDLREEERIVVYRKLIQDMLMNGVPMPDDNSRHVVAEILNSIFDIDKMLYFVAPEWWRPRAHRGRKPLMDSRPSFVRPAFGDDVIKTAYDNGFKLKTYDLSQTERGGVMASNTVGWGGLQEAGRDNYYITDESEPVKLGSSLGWLLQLDGDNMRNAFLNAPWVKAVIPIRPGKEEAAINWLKGVEGMNGITDDVIYKTANLNEKDVKGNPYNGQKMIDVLMDLGKKVKRKYEEGIEMGKYPKLDEVADPALVDEENTVTSTPIDRVYEHGFFPLEGSFRANVGKNYEIFDQWIEIVPTDQIVPVEVKYDPKTGRQM